MADLAYLLDARYLSLSVRLGWSGEPNASSGRWAGVGSVIAIFAGPNAMSMKTASECGAKSVPQLRCTDSWQVKQAAVSDEMLSRLQPASDIGTDLSSEQKRPHGSVNSPYPNQGAENGSATRVTLALSTSKMAHTLLVWIEGGQAASHRHCQHCVRLAFVEKVRPLLHRMKWTHVHKVSALHLKTILKRDSCVV